MGPGAGYRAVKMIAAGLGRKLRLGVAADVVAENRIALEVHPLVVVIDEDILRAPSAVH
jgi:hypothetical protein